MITMKDKTEIINLQALKNKNIDYLALGHIHKYKQEKLDNRGIYCYSGCLEGRGFDEVGPKGFVEVDVSKGHVVSTFRPFSSRIIEEYSVDVSGLDGAIAMCHRIEDQVPFDVNNIYRINLCGKLDALQPEYIADIQVYLSPKGYLVDIKDKTEKIMDIQQYEGDISIRGEFIRRVWNSDAYTDEEKTRMLQFGLRALEGKEVLS